MSSTLLNTSPVWTAAGWTMLHMIGVGAVIGLAALLVRQLLRSACPELRYALALTCLLSFAFTPVLVFIHVFEPSEGTPLAMLRAARVASDSSPSLTNPAGSARSRPEPSLMASARLTGPPRHSWLKAMVPYLPYFWLSGSFSTLIMLATGLVGVERLRRSSRLVQSGDIAQRCRALADSLGIARRVSVGVCERLAVPVLVGIIRPLILLPPIALCGWSVEQLEMVLLHELAHLRRWDNLVNLLQRGVESLLFFHPVVWWLSGWVRLERELCCDRLVVDRLGQPDAYAEMLVELSGTSRRGGQAQVAMADRHVLIRIRGLLNLKERSMKLTMPEGLGLLGAVVVGTSLIIGSQGAQTKPANDSDKTTRPVPGTAVDDIRDMPDKPLADRPATSAGAATDRPSKPASPRDPRATWLFRRDARRLEIQQLPTTPEGVATYRCRGGIEIICNTQKFGTIRMEADEALIKRTRRQRDDEPTAMGPHHETWFDEADVPMEVHLKGNAVLRRDEDRVVGKGDARIVRAPELDYDFVTGRLLAQPANAVPSVPAFEALIGHAVATITDQLTVPDIGERAVSLLPRNARAIEITESLRTIDGVVKYVCKGGIKIVSKSPRSGVITIEADEAVIVRGLRFGTGGTIAGTSGGTWVEEDHRPMEVHAKGHVVLSRDPETIAGKVVHWSIRADQLDYDLVSEHLVAVNVEGNTASGDEFTATRLELYPPARRSR